MKKTENIDFLKEILNQNKNEDELLENTFINKIHTNKKECKWCNDEIVFMSNVWRINGNTSYVFCSKDCILTYKIYKKLEETKTVARSRKNHLCFICSYPIKKGDFYWKTSDKTLCSKECRDKWNIVNEKNDHGKSICLFDRCGIEFIKRSANQKYCSVECYRKKSDRINEQKIQENKTEQHESQ